MVHDDPLAPHPCVVQQTTASKSARLRASTRDAYERAHMITHDLFSLTIVPKFEIVQLDYTLAINVIQEVYQLR